VWRPDDVVRAAGHEMTFWSAGRNRRVSREERRIRQLPLADPDRFCVNAERVCNFAVRLVGRDQDLDELDYAIDLMSSSRNDALNHDGESPWMTPAEAAREVGLTPHAIRAWIARGELPAERTGPRRLRIRRSDLEQLLRAVRQSHGPARSEAEQADISVLQRPPTPGARLIEMQGTSDG
jgi:excisionase family DNA binding protein